MSKDEKAQVKANGFPAKALTMPFPEFDPVIFQIGPFALRWYALAYVAGILLGWRYAVMLVKDARLWNGRAPTLSPTQIDDLVLWVTLGVIVGGRLGYVLFYSPQIITEDPLQILMVWRGGMSFHGGLIGVTVALVGYAASQKVDLFRLADLVAPCVPFGLFFGRVANFINSELWGRPTDAPWGVVFPNGGPLARHPSQLYEAALEGIVLFILPRLATHKWLWLQRRGAVVGLFLLAYAVFRMSLENVREPDAFLPDFPLGLTMGMMLSMPMAIAGAWLLWQGLREPLPAQADEPA
jgi:phosphatidylglycerol:prolipoprotein diacylglycerol transferase